MGNFCSAILFCHYDTPALERRWRNVSLLQFIPDDSIHILLQSGQHVVTLLCQGENNVCNYRRVWLEWGGQSVSVSR
jgi:hypothetical protein